MKRILSVIVMIVATVTLALGQEMTHAQNAKPSSDAEAAKEMGIFPPSEVKWSDGPASLPAGAKFTVLQGDLSKEGFFTIRLWLPDGFRIQPHWHSKTEHVTVISGTLNFGMGEKFDQNATRVMPAGTFGFWKEGMRHFSWAKGDTVLQVHGMGPWMITYVNPADDPRSKKK